MGRGMKWKLSEWAAVAEIIAAVGVILSLIFVGLQSPGASTTLPRIRSGSCKSHKASRMAGQSSGWRHYCKSARAAPTALPPGTVAPQQAAAGRISFEGQDHFRKGHSQPNGVTLALADTVRLQQPQSPASGFQVGS